MQYRIRYYLGEIVHCGFFIVGPRLTSSNTGLATEPLRQRFSWRLLYHSVLPAALGWQQRSITVSTLKEAVRLWVDFEGIILRVFRNSRRSDCGEHVFVHRRQGRAQRVDQQAVPFFCPDIEGLRVGKHEIPGLGRIEQHKLFGLCVSLEQDY